MKTSEPAGELTDGLAGLRPGDALDLACGAGRHAGWLAARGWNVTAVDRDAAFIPGVRFVKADLEHHEFQVRAAEWDLIVCWLYWQADLMPAIAAGVRPGGTVALAGKTTGRFATSLNRFRAAFPGWIEISSGEPDMRAWFIATRPRSITE